MIDRLFKIGSYPLVAIGMGAIFTVSYIFALKTGFAATAPMYRQNEWASDQVSRFTKSISSAREAALAYSDSATKMHTKIDAAIGPIIVTCKSVSGMPIVGTWLAKSGINEQVVSLQRLEILLGKAQAANLAVSAVVAAPGRDKLEAAVNCMHSLQQALANEVIL